MRCRPYFIKYTVFSQIRKLAYQGLSKIMKQKAELSLELSSILLQWSCFYTSFNFLIHRTKTTPKRIKLLISAAMYYLAQWVKMDTYSYHQPDT